MKEHIIKIHLANGKCVIVSVDAETEKEAVCLAKPVKIESLWTNSAKED